MTIAQFVEAFQNELECRPLEDLETWAREAERDGRRWLLALIREVMGRRLKTPGAAPL